MSATATHPARVEMIRVALLLSSLVACAPAAPTPTPTPVDQEAQTPAPAEDPKRTWHIGQHNAVLDEQRAKGPALYDFPRAYQAEAIQDRHTPVDAVRDVTFDGAPLLWFTPAVDAVVVDARWLSDVTVADATRLGDRVVHVATLTPEARGRMDVVGWTDWLIRGGGVLTFVHLEATLQLDGVRADGEDEIALVSGTHLYYTNERNEVRYAFEVRLRRDGRLEVQGRAR